MTPDVTLREMVVSYLKQHGLTGLANVGQACSCSVDDIFSRKDEGCLSCPREDCLAGHLWPCHEVPGGCDEDKNVPHLHVMDSPRRLSRSPR